MPQAQPTLLLPEPIHALRAIVGAADHVLTPTAFQATLRLHAERAARAIDWSLLAPEYGKAEYLLGVDSTGEPACAPVEMVQDLERALADSPDLALWFQPAHTAAGTPVVLIARWLCHLAGYRHRTVLLYIDHPTAPDYTLVQVRGLGKVQYPGCFDLPTAGHVVGLATVKEAVLQELGEELGLAPADVLGLELLGCREHRPSAERRLWNVEWCTILRGRLASGGLERLRFVDGEVAAIAVFSLSELQALVVRDPERIASGLLESLPLYRSKTGNCGNERNGGN